MLKSKLGNFPVLTCLIYFPLLIVSFYLFYMHGADGAAAAFLWGSSISFLLIAGTVSVSKRMLTNNQSMMLAFVFGGMMVRFIVVIACTVFVFYRTDLQLTYFLTGLFGSYIVLQVFEIVHITKKQAKQVLTANGSSDKINQ